VSFKHQPALDALRGACALTVTACHIIVFAGGHPWPQAANVAVDGFFMLSGYVLAGAYDGQFGRFIARRFVRLWPVYAICLTIGYAMHGMTPTLAELIWWPTDRFYHLDLTDKPVWTLYIEAWATPLLPILVLIARNSRAVGMLVAGAALLLAMWLPGRAPLYLALFAVGVGAAQFAIPLPTQMPAPAVWLGKIAYSLYLTNWLVLDGFGLAAGAALILPAAWVMWWVVERQSITMSRRFGRSRGAVPNS
jgi:peptidoglycan/LPS O-acetylase OafA/YrhL